MGWIVEADDEGNILIPAHMLGYPKPGTRYLVEHEGEVIVITRIQDGQEAETVADGSEVAHVDSGQTEQER